MASVIQRGNYSWFIILTRSPRPFYVWSPIFFSMMLYKITFLVGPKVRKYQAKIQCTRCQHAQCSGTHWLWMIWNLNNFTCCDLTQCSLYTRWYNPTVSKRITWMGHRLCRSYRVIVQISYWLPICGSWDLFA